MKPRMNIFSEPEPINTKSIGQKIKELTGPNDSLFQRIGFEDSFKSMFRLNPICVENSPCLDIRYDITTLNEKTNSSCQIKSDGDFSQEFNNVVNLFDCLENILNFSDGEFKIIWNQLEKCFYVNEIDSNQIYRCVFDDIELIHKQVYGQTIVTQEIKSIELLSNGTIKYNYGEKKFIGKSLDTKLFKCFISNSFDVTNTIFELCQIK